MPIYEYECQQCGKVFESIRKFSDPPLTECECEEKAPVTKLVSAAAFHLKGSGWYVTDFRDKKGAGKAGGSGGDDGDGGDGGGKSDSDAKKPDGGDTAGAGAEAAKKKKGGDKDAKAGGSGSSKSARSGSSSPSKATSD